MVGCPMITNRAGECPGSRLPPAPELPIPIDLTQQMALTVSNQRPLCALRKALCIPSRLAADQHPRGLGDGT